jgi:hypothetical protein
VSKLAEGKVDELPMKRESLAKRKPSVARFA